MFYSFTHRVENLSPTWIKDTIQGKVFLCKSEKSSSTTTTTKTSFRFQYIVQNPPSSCQITSNHPSLKTDETFIVASVRAENIVPTP